MEKKKRISFTHRVRCALLFLDLVILLATWSPYRGESNCFFWQLQERTSAIWTNHKVKNSWTKELMIQRGFDLLLKRYV